QAAAPEGCRRGAGLRETNQNARSARAQCPRDQRNQGAKFRFFPLSVHAGDDKRSARGSRGILGCFLQKKGWPMGLPGMDLNHRAAFLYARIGAALMALIAHGVMAAAGSALIVQDAWVRQVPGSNVAAVYLTLRNPTKQPIGIVGVESSLAS